MSYVWSILFNSVLVIELIRAYVTVKKGYTEE